MTEAAALLIRRRRPIGEPDEIEPRSMPGFSLLHGTAGAGRALVSLGALGRTFGELTQCVHDAEVDAAAIDELDLGVRFATVILASHLVNTPDEALRRAWLRAAGRHAAEDGEVLVEHHPVDWAETAADEPATPGGPLGMVDVRRDPPFVHAVSVYDVGGHEVRQPFTARVLSQDELQAEVLGAGLGAARPVSPTWLVGRAPVPSRERAAVPRRAT